VLEVGSGPGDLLDSFAGAGWSVTGLEPAVEVAEACRKRGLDVRAETLEQFLASSRMVSADVIVLRLVLEHVRDPIGLLRSAHSGLRTGGTLIVEVPNDFNPLQEAARRTYELDRWWIAAPDHINYFDFPSLTRILEKLGFDIVERSTTFPMELFLLMGDNYVGDPETGAACHRRRQQLELSLDSTARRSLYGALAQAGLGRTCLMAAVAR
jgi:SAM-dependent methyltransferase